MPEQYVRSWLLPRPALRSYLEDRLSHPVGFHEDTESPLGLVRMDMDLDLWRLHGEEDRPPAQVALCCAKCLDEIVRMWPDEELPLLVAHPGWQDTSSTGYEAVPWRVRVNCERCGYDLILRMDRLVRYYLEAQQLVMAARGANRVIVGEVLLDPEGQLWAVHPSERFVATLRKNTEPEPEIAPDIAQTEAVTTEP